MKYLGSKNRISKYISPILQQYINDNGITTYYEPFVGGANIIDKIDCPLRIGNDIHPQLIAMFLALQKWMESTRAYYRRRISKYKAKQRKISRLLCGICRI